MWYSLAAIIAMGMVGFHFSPLSTSCYSTHQGIVFTHQEFPEDLLCTKSCRRHSLWTGEESESCVSVHRIHFLMAKETSNMNSLSQIIVICLIGLILEL